MGKRTQQALTYVVQQTEVGKSAGHMRQIRKEAAYRQCGYT